MKTATTSTGSFQPTLAGRLGSRPVLSARELAAVALSTGRRLAALAHGADFGADMEYSTLLAGSSRRVLLETVLASLSRERARMLVIANGIEGERLIASAAGFAEVIPYRLPWVEALDPDTLDEVLFAYDGAVTHVVIAQHEPSTGLVNPVDECAAVARQHGVEIVVDIGASFGALPLGGHPAGIDYIVGESSRSLGPGVVNGIAFVVARNASLTRIRPTSLRSRDDLIMRYDLFAKRGVFVDTPDGEVLARLAYRLGELVGTPALDAQRRSLAHRHATVREGIEALGFGIVLRPHEQALSVSATLPRNSPFTIVELTAALRSEGFAVRAVQFSPVDMFSIPTGELGSNVEANRLVSAVRRFARQCEDDDIDDSCEPTAKRGPYIALSA